MPRNDSSSDEDTEIRKRKEEARKRRRDAYNSEKAARKQREAERAEEKRIAMMSPEERKTYNRAKEQARLEQEVQQRRQRVREQQQKRSKELDAEEEDYKRRRSEWEKEHQPWNLESEGDDDEVVVETTKMDDSTVDPLEAFMATLETNNSVRIIGVNDQMKKTIALDEIRTENWKNRHTQAPEAEPNTKTDDDFLSALRNMNPLQTSSTLEERESEHKKRLKEQDEKLLLELETKTKGKELIDVDYDEEAFKDRSYRREDKTAAVKELKFVDHSKINYPEFRKCFYVEAAAIRDMTEEEVKEFRKSQDNTKIKSADGKKLARPIQKWEQCGLADSIISTIRSLSFEVPFPIQSQGIPIIMSGRDMIGCARTGSGKTLTYVLPMLRHIVDQPPLGTFDGPIGFVLIPTRELAIQVDKEVKRFGTPLGVKSLAAYGGASISEHIAECKRGIHAIIGTPGRVVDLMVANKGKVLNTLRATYCVLDEADRMFDLGFGPQVAKIIANIRPDRQCVMFSATFPKQIELAAKKFLTNPAEVIIGGRCAASTNILQIVECFEDPSHKFLRLLQILGEWYEKSLILIFCERQEDVDKLWENLYANRYNEHCVTLHGGMDQVDRDLALFDYKMTGKHILIATSVASRGIDVDCLDLVINYDCPSHKEDFIHRTGRTGRAGKKGTAITFYDIGRDEQHATWLVSILNNSNGTVPEELQIIANAFWEKRKAGLVTNWRPNTGFDMRGGYKFDTKESRKKREDVRAQMRARGLVTDSDDEKSYESSDDGHVEVNIDKDRPAGQTVGGQLVVQSTRGIEKAKRYAEEYSKALARQAELAAEGKFSSELEINDYAAPARAKVTNRAACRELLQDFGGDVSVTTKGIWCKGNPPKGEKKLYLLIEGRSEAAVQGAKRKLQEHLDNETSRILAGQSALGIGRARR
eukprot:TRINITY_DN2464_c0_g1_i2.p1 TRINITY_DN2464_c0_g1~~TRINITY_DN2464_c0_g1_i2.p1  ORF type:complete len:929 (+),score=236.31 TRINITY_DN2464_c0_g1_i2:44-2830(+)